MFPDGRVVVVAVEINLSRQRGTGLKGSEVKKGNSDVTNKFTVRDCRKQVSIVRCRASRASIGSLESSQTRSLAVVRDGYISRAGIFSTDACRNMVDHSFV